VDRPRGNYASLLQEFSVPLISGVVLALVAANVDHELYESLLALQPFGDVSVFGHAVTFHFLVNEVFMVFFFAMAAKEITEASLPGGQLNPLSKAVSPLVATVGGVVGPIAAFLGALAAAFAAGFYSLELHDPVLLARGWGIPTATDIALAWLVARAVFGNRHPAVVFLLLLAIADDAIGLVIIAVFYGDPTQPAKPEWLLLSLGGMALGYAFKRIGVMRWEPYVVFAGPLAWCGLMLAHLHPALALTFVVPFIPGDRRDLGLFVMRADTSAAAVARASPLERFGHQVKGFVDFGLFFFAFANAGVELADVGPLTWIILGALVVGKTVGVAFLALASEAVGFPLPEGMTRRDLVMAGFIASLGLTVALFVATAAYVDPVLQGQAKMGALLSGGVGIVAVPVARLLGIRKQQRTTDPHGDPAHLG
jgi:NhaA family Na+:H+ antiporter